MKSGSHDVTVTNKDARARPKVASQKMNAKKVASYQLETKHETNLPDCSTKCIAFKIFDWLASDFLRKSRKSESHSGEKTELTNQLT